MPRRGQRLKLANEPAEAPREMIFYARRSKALLVLALSIVFCLAGFFLIPRNELVGWLGLIFGALGVLAGLLLLAFPRLSSLWLTADGFTTASLFGSCFIRSQDVAGFEVGLISMNTMVVFNFSTVYTAGKKFGKMVASDLSGERGENYFVNLNPTKGRAQTGRRSVLVLSSDAVNQLPLVVTVVVGTDGANTARDYPTNVCVDPRDSGLPIESVFLCFQMRSLDPFRFPAQPDGKRSVACLSEVDDAVRFCLDL